MVNAEPTFGKRVTARVGSSLTGLELPGASLEPLCGLCLEEPSPETQ